MAIAEQKVRGLDSQEELFEKEFVRDTRTVSRKMFDFLASKAGASSILICFGIVPLFIPITTYFVLFLAVPVYMLRKKATSKPTLPFRMPATSDQLDYSDPIPGRQKFFKSEGIFYLGNEYRSIDELWLKAKDILTHMLVLGTTGSGKTEALVSLAFNAVAMGSGFFYIDPKAAPKLAMQIYQMSRLCGRDDDFLLLSYSTAGKKRTKNPTRLSNTTNPFAFGSPEGLTNLVVSLIPASEGDNAIFGQNAQTLITGLMYALCELRDRGELELSIKTLRENMTLHKYMEIAKRPDLSETSRAAIQSFLTSVGWQEGKPLDKQPRSLTEQFGYARGYFGLTLASMVDTYGHIYDTPTGEVDMYDVIKNRRILVTMLPALEKAPQELSNLGKISLSGVRLACAVGLGDKIEGSVEDVLDALPTDSPTPFLSITDEYAAIPTPGYAEVLTQGRGLGIAAIVASQDFAGIKGADETGAQQIVANTKMKWAMKTEDASSTWSLFRDIASESSVMQTSGYHMDPKQNSLGLAYKDQGQSSLQKVNRVNLRDLQEQIEGEFHAFFNGNVVRGRSFYANPNLDSSVQLRINRFLHIEQPDVPSLQYRLSKVKELSDVLEKEIRSRDKKVAPKAHPQMKPLIEPFKNTRGLVRSDLAIASLLNWCSGSDEAAGELMAQREKVRKDRLANSTEGTSKTDEHEIDKTNNDEAGDFLPPGGTAYVEPTESSTHGAPDSDTAHWPVAQRGETAKEDKWRSQLSGYAHGRFADADMEKDVARGEQIMGASKEASELIAKKTTKQIMDSIRYPEPPEPKKDIAQAFLKQKAEMIISRSKSRRGDNTNG